MRRLLAGRAGLGALLAVVGRQVVGASGAGELAEPTSRTRRGALRTLGGSEHSTGSPLANRLGLQIARVAWANAAFRLRRRRVDADLRPYVEAYERDGIVVIEDFLPAEDFARIRDECRAAHDAGLFRSECVEDNSILEEWVAPRRHGDRMRATATLGRHEWLLRFASAITRLPSPKRITVEVSYMTKASDVPQPRRLIGMNYIHADVHYPSAKAWLFLDDIDHENGAFVYAKGSQRLSLAKLAYEYGASIRAAKAMRSGTMYRTVPATVVRAPSARQLRSLRIAETAFGGKANTLVVANVGGFHKRGEFAQCRRREQIQMKFGDRPGARKKPRRGPGA